jgi:23S rRNA pseudouridine955/2504/2580 synthase
LIELVVDDDLVGMRPDRALRHRYPDLDRAFALQLLKTGRILVDGATARLATVLASGQRIAVQVKAERLGAPALVVDVVFEGEGLVVVDKPAGLAMHHGPGVPPDEQTLRDVVAERFDVEAGFDGPSFLGRLDRPTSGLVVALLQRTALHALEPRWRAGALQKEYLVVVHGAAPDDRVIDIPLAARRPQHRGTGKREECVTEMLTLAKTSKASLVLVEPKTGRTHQIRRHMKAIGHPVVGDARYGDPARDRKLLGVEPELLLHAWRYRHAGEIEGLPQDVVAGCPPRFVEACRSFGVDAPAVLKALLAAPLPGKGPAADLG